jgi:REP element-mobilizing transposase RayT
MRAHRRVPNLRSQALFAVVRRELSRNKLAWFRIVHFSVQSTHIHLIVEAESALALSRGMASLTIRVAKSVNVASRRRGAFVGERYHAHVLKTPREVRHAIVYVLLNHKKHGVGLMGLDPMSSACAFDGFVPSIARERPPNTAVQPARTWLLSRGWRRCPPSPLHRINGMRRHLQCKSRTQPVFPVPEFFR